MDEKLIPENVPFCHPLSEVDEVEGVPTVNSWGFSSTIVNGILNPGINNSDPDKCKQLCEILAISGNAELNVGLLIEGIEQRQMSSCLIAANAIVEGFKKRASQSFNA